MQFIATTLKFYGMALLLFVILRLCAGSMFGGVIALGIIAVAYILGWSHPLVWLGYAFPVPEFENERLFCWGIAAITLPLWAAFLWESVRKIRNRQTFAHEIYRNYKEED